MKRIAFINYSQDEEKPHGDYWKFVESTNEEIQGLNIDYGSLCEVIMKVSNNELKEKMKARLKEFLKVENLIENGCYFFSKGLFNDEEIKQIIEGGNYIDFLKSLIENQIMNGYYIYGCVELFLYMNDSETITKSLAAIIDLIKDQGFVSEVLINILNIVKNRNNGIYEYLVEYFKDYLSEKFLFCLKINKDPEYLKNESNRFLEKRIGIDPRIKIGVEMEANVQYNFSIDFASQRGLITKYSTDYDPTVPGGFEIKSSPFHDTEKEVAEFCAVCDALTKMGYYYDESIGNAAGQINLGLDYLDSPSSIINFYEIFCNVEELLFYISNKEGQVIRQSIYQNSRFKPISEIIGKRIIDEEAKREDIISLFNQTINKQSDIPRLRYKTNTLCLRGEWEEDYRFEIRIPNGGVDYMVWIDNIRLYGKMMEISKKLADACSRDYMTDEEQRLLRLKLDLEDSELSIEEKLTILMNLLFIDEKTRDIYYRRFKSVKERINNGAYSIYHVPKDPVEPMFGTVEFEGKEMQGDRLVVSYDPDNNQYNEFDNKRKMQ